MNCWLMKSEPETFSIQDLAKAPKRTTGWDGVRNYQARNFMQAMRKGDRVLFYHSSADPTAVVGTATVVREAYPDSSAWDKNDSHYDPKSSAANPIWQRVDIQFESEFARPVTLEELRGVKELAKMVLLQRGSRLSVQPVTKAEFDVILKLSKTASGSSLRSTQTTRAKKSAKAPAKKKQAAKRK